MVWLDLTELDTVFRGRWLWSTRRPSFAWFRRADYLGDPSVPLEQAVRDRVQQDTRVETVVAEITNTPWNERHACLLGERQNEGHGEVLRYRFGKRFHVSPFIGMDVACDWRFSSPDGKLAVHMEDHQEGARLFDATHHPEAAPARWPDGARRASAARRCYGKRTERCPLSATLQVHDPRFWSELAFGGSIGAGEACMQGYWTTDGLTDLVRILLHNREVLDGMESGLA